MDVSPAQQAARDKIAAELAAVGFALPGTLTDPRLRLRQTQLPLPRRPAPAARPLRQWTRKIGGKTVTRRLTEAELTAWQPLFDNAKKIRALLAELQDLTLEIIETSPRQEQ